MVLPPAPQPRFWKALIFAAIPAGFVLWTIFGRSAMPAWIGLLIWAVASLAVAGIIHARVSDDWRSKYVMNLHGFEHRANVTRNVTVRRK
ncbi:MAG TPA: hypothetical protein VIG46_12495 [Candidatus Baltobacteraceae bacterium]|jgi:hypothetical protein